MFHERGVDERLIVTAAAFLHLPLEPSNYIIVKPNGDPSLSLRNPDNRATLRL
jgi:hypothetical protein